CTAEPSLLVARWPACGRPPASIIWKIFLFSTSGIKNELADVSCPLSPRNASARSGSPDHRAVGDFPFAGNADHVVCVPLFQRAAAGNACRNHLQVRHHRPADQSSSGADKENSL